MTLQDTAARAYQATAFRCPRCMTGLSGYECPNCCFYLRTCNGIIHALPPERVAYYARFIEDYERIRAAEGRGGGSAAAYIGLPYRDFSGKPSKQWTIRARSFDYLLSQILQREGFSKGASVLDLGAGNGWMSYRLALAGFRPVAVDLLVNEADGLGAAEHYRPFLPDFFPRFRAEFTRLPFACGQFDCAVFNSSFHYSEHPDLAIEEALRTLRRGGVLVISDTPWYSSEEAGQKMMAERRALFLARYGTASDSIQGLEFLTEERLQRLERQCGIRWEIHTPWYGPTWALRPFLAKVRGRREPATFRIYVARKD